MIKGMQRDGIAANDCNIIFTEYTPWIDFIPQYRIFQVFIMFFYKFLCGCVLSDWFTICNHHFIHIGCINFTFTRWYEKLLYTNQWLKIDIRFQQMLIWFISWNTNKLFSLFCFWVIWLVLDAVTWCIYPYSSRIPHVTETIATSSVY